jgi:ATP-dependent exoDNAse (exonuclease V) alpha subunit
LASKLSVFTSKLKELPVGEQVRINANMHEVGLINGDLVTVHAISSEQELITLELQDGRKVSLSSNRPLPMDYGYCSTVYSAQGQTCDRILIEADTHNLTANESSYYVAISRARHEAMIYTDDKEGLPMAMSRIFEKSSALELSSEAKKIEQYQDYSQVIFGD